ncbi:MAG: ATP-binding protein [Rickettsiales bacterium]|nr:ATP-binding protein [Rickettsiales bacterium]
MKTTAQIPADCDLCFLVVEDSDVDVMVISQHLANAFTDCAVDVVGTLADAKASLADKSYDYVVVDLYLPDSEGLDTLREIMNVAQELPVLVYTGVENAEWSLEALKIGAQDYLIKGRGDASTIRRIIKHTMERKRIEQRIFQNEQMLRTFIKHSPAGIAVFDNEFRIIMCSDRWKAEHGVANRQVIGERLDDLFIHSSTKWNYLYSRCMNGELVRGDEDKFVTNDGVEEYIRWEMMPWYDGNEHIGGVIQFTEFVTKEREMRNALQDAKDNLELKVKERTVELEAAMAATESAQRAKNEFFANITHELRTPLHAIINFSNFGIKKIDKAKPEKLLDYFTDINKSGKRLLGLVNDVLDLTKHQFGKTSFEMGMHPVGETIEDALKEVSAIAETYEVKLVADVKDSIDEAVFDRVRIHQVLINLLSNAIKFTERGTSVTVAVEMSEDVGMLKGAVQQMVFAVIDQGKGIPDDELDEIFDEFAQSKKVKSGTFSAGTGLGLSICRHIVNGHNGAIWAENVKDGGAKVIFTIPLMELDEESGEDDQSSGD